MSNEKFTNELPSIVLDKEDREAYQRSRKQGKAKTGTPEPETKQTSGTSGWVTFLVFLIAASACGAAYWLYEQNLKMSAQLASAESRINDLERRLSATGEEMDQSAVALQVKVNELSEKADELWRQMDKLWASAWRKNQAELKALATKVNNDDEALKRQIGVVEEEVGLSNTNLELLQEQVSDQLTKTQDVEILLGEIDRKGDGFKRQFGDIQAKLIAVDQVNSGLTRRLAELEKWRKEEANKPVTPPPAQVVDTTPVQSQTNQ